MEKLERIIELSQSITSLRTRRAVLAEELTGVDNRIGQQLAELSQYVPDLSDTNESFSQTKDSRSGTYQKGSVAYRILAALAEAPRGLNGADLTVVTGVENKQIHSGLSRLTPVGHIERQILGPRHSVYVITEAGRAAMANAKEGSGDDSRSLDVHTLVNDESRSMEQ